MSRKFQAAGRIAVALKRSERSLNQAAIDLMAVGISTLEARNTGDFHPLEGQREFEQLGGVLTTQLDAIGQMARVHDKMFARARQTFDVTDTGKLCPWPSEEDPKGHAGNVVELAATRAAEA